MYRRTALPPLSTDPLSPHPTSNIRFNQTRFWRNRNLDPPQLIPCRIQSFLHRPLLAIPCQPGIPNLLLYITTRLDRSCSETLPNKNSTAPCLLENAACPTRLVQKNWTSIHHIIPGLDRLLPPRSTSKSRKTSYQQVHWRITIIILIIFSHSP